MQSLFPLWRHKKKITPHKRLWHTVRSNSLRLPSWLRWLHKKKTWLLRETDANNNIAIPVNRRNGQLAGTTRHVSLVENAMPLCSLNAICSAAGDTLFGGECLCQDSRCFRRAEGGTFGKGRYRPTCRTVLCERISRVVREDTAFPLRQTLIVPFRSQPVAPFQTMRHLSWGGEQVSL